MGWRQRLLAGLVLLALGSAVGMGAARWHGGDRLTASAAPASPEVSAAPFGASLVAAGGPAAALTPARAGTGRAVVAQLDADELLRADPSPADWRLARLRGDPQVMVLEFPGLGEQGAAMNRAAAFIEKDGAPRDRVLDDSELAQLIRRQGDNPQTFFQGHDYSGDHLAEFFTAVRRQRLRLNDQEQRLLQLLLDSRVLETRGTGYTALGLQAIVTFTGIQPDDPATPQDEAIDARRRESVLRHELSHGLFFTSAAYREHCWRFWRTRLSAKERAVFIRFLSGLNYDARNEELLVNEVQALLMHTPDTRAFDAASVGMTDAQLERLRARFREGLPVR